MNVGTMLNKSNLLRVIIENLISKLKNLTIFNYAVILFTLPVPLLMIRSISPVFRFKCHLSDRLK